MIGGKEILNQRLDRYAIPVGVAALVACVAIGSLPRAHVLLFNAYLFAWLFWLGVSLGCMGLTMMHLLTGGNWGTLIRPITSSAARMLPLLFVLFAPVLLGLHDLFPWARPEQVAHDPILIHEHQYLNPSFFVIRFIIYFAVWIAMAWPVTAWPLGEGVRLRRDQRSRAGAICSIDDACRSRLDDVAPAALDEHRFRIHHCRLAGTHRTLLCDRRFVDAVGTPASSLICRPIRLQ